MSGRSSVSKWMKFFPDDWLAGTRMLPPLAKAAYIDLLCFSWKHESIPEDLKLLASFCGLSFEDFVEAWSLLRGKWELHPTQPGRLVNAKQEEVRAVQVRRAAAGKRRMSKLSAKERSDQAKLAAKARWNSPDAQEVPAKEPAGCEQACADECQHEDAESAWGDSPGDHDPADCVENRDTHADDASSMPAGCQQLSQERARDSGLRVKERDEPGPPGRSPGGGGGSAEGDLATRITDLTVRQHGIDSGRRHELERLFLGHIKGLTNAGASPEQAGEALVAGIGRCSEAARQQAPSNRFGKLLHKLRGDGGDDLGGLVRSAIEGLIGGEA